MLVLGVHLFFLSVILLVLGGILFQIDVIPFVFGVIWFVLSVILLIFGRIDRYAFLQSETTAEGKEETDNKQ